MITKIQKIINLIFLLSLTLSVSLKKYYAVNQRRSENTSGQVQINDF